MSRFPSEPSETSRWSIQMWWAPFTTVTASAPSWQSPFEATSEQLRPTTARFWRMSLDVPSKVRLPVILAPDMPTIVLFDPILKLPLNEPETWMTAADEPLTAELKALAELTGVAGALPPPVVVLMLPIEHPLAAQPTRALEVVVPPVPVAPPVALVPPVPVVPPVAGVPPVPVVPPVAFVPPVPVV